MTHLDVYGMNHSPWVQALLLGLHEKRISHSLRSTPAFEQFRAIGILMPTARIDGGPWKFHSYEILQQVGFERVSPQELSEVYRAWVGVQHRVDNALRFFTQFSYVTDSSSSTWRRLCNHVLRSFISLYFYLMLKGMVLFSGVEDPENLGDPFRNFEQRLADQNSRFLCGEAPGIVDLLLFGVMQCHCSIPVPQIKAVQEDPELSHVRAWIAAMQERFADYPHLYSGVYFEPYSPAPARSSRVDQAAFWFGAICMLIAFPVTFALIAYYAIRVGRAGLRGPGDEAAVASS